MELKKIYAEKKAFVEKELAAMLLKLGEEIASVEYDTGSVLIDGAPVSEYVRVIYNCGFDRHINITGDSLKGIVSDVIKKL